VKPPKVLALQSLIYANKQDCTNVHFSLTDNFSILGRNQVSGYAENTVVTILVKRTVFGW